MPYTGARDTSLPNRIKALSLDKRETWVSTFNETMSFFWGAHGYAG